MEKKKLIGIRVSAHTEKQIAELIDRLGLNQTEVVLLAVDRLFREMEGGRPSGKKNSLK